MWRVWRCDRVWRFFQSISITAFRGGLCVLASHPVTPSHLNKLNILKYILKIKFYSSSSILIRHSCLIIKPLNPPCGFFFPNRSFLSYLKLVIRCISFWISQNGLEIWKNNLVVLQGGFFVEGEGWRVKGSFFG